MKHDSLGLYEYNLWANERVFQRLQEIPHEVCEQEIQSVFPTIAQTLKHILLTDHVWLLAMKGETYENVGRTVGPLSQELEKKSLDEIRARFVEASEQFKDFFSQINLDATAPYSHPTMGTIHAPYSDIIQHVVNHGTYHRGNISAMLRQLGYEGASHDYIYFLFEESQKQNS